MAGIIQQKNQKSKIFSSNNLDYNSQNLDQNDDEREYAASKIELISKSRKKQNL